MTNRFDSSDVEKSLAIGAENINNYGRLETVGRTYSDAIKSTYPNITNVCYLVANPAGRWGRGRK